MVHAERWRVQSKKQKLSRHRARRSPLAHRRLRSEATPRHKAAII